VSGLVRRDFWGVNRSRLVLTGHEDRHIDYKSGGGHDASHPRLPDGGEGQDCRERQDQRAKPENLPPFHKLQPLTALRVPTLSRRRIRSRSSVFNARLVPETGRLQPQRCSNS
jgi:hypothetical protein